MIELHQRFHSGGIRSVESNSSYMADMFSLTSDMLMPPWSPTSDTTLSPPQPVFSQSTHMDGTNQHHQPQYQNSPQRPPPHPSFGNTNSNNSTEMSFRTNFSTLPTSKSSAIILNHPNDNSTAGDDNEDDFDEVWSYVAVRLVSLLLSLFFTLLSYISHMI
jgi:hypothetical protein